MRNKSAYLLGTAVGVLVLNGSGQASDTVIYSYDALGRLVATSTTGGTNDGLGVSTAYDPAGNRTNYSVSGASGSPPPPPPPPPSPPPPPPPPPPPGNQPPVAVADVGSQNRCTEASYDVLANDSDPDGNLPLVLVSVSGGGTRGTPTIFQNKISFTPNGLNGTALVDYTMRDSLGATASTTLTITLSGAVCA